MFVRDCLVCFTCYGALGFVFVRFIGSLFAVILAFGVCLGFWWCIDCFFWWICNSVAMIFVVI